MTYAQRGDRPAPIAEQNRICLRIWSAYRCMALGTAGREEWADLADAMNIVESLCMIGTLDVGIYMPLVIVAQAGMVAAMRCDPEPMAMQPEQLEALRLIVDRYDICLARLSVNTLARARSYFLGVQVKHAIRPDASTLVVMA